MSLTMQNSRILFDLVFLIENDMHKKNPDDVNRLYKGSREFPNGQNLSDFPIINPRTKCTCLFLLAYRDKYVFLKSNGNPNLEQTIKQSADNTLDIFF